MYRYRTPHQVRAGRRETSALLGRTVPTHSRQEFTEGSGSPPPSSQKGSLAYEVSRGSCWRGSAPTEAAHPGQAHSHHVHEALTTGGPGNEHRTNKPPTRRVWERSERDAMCPSTSQNPSCWHLSWLSNACTTRKNSKSQQLANDDLETNPVPMEPEAESHMAEQPSWSPQPAALRGPSQHIQEKCNKWAPCCL